MCLGFPLHDRLILAWARFEIITIEIYNSSTCLICRLGPSKRMLAIGNYGVKIQSDRCQNTYMRKNWSLRGE